MSETDFYVVHQTEIGERLDKFLAGKKENELSRTRIKKLIDEGCVKVNSKTSNSSYKLKLDDTVEIFIPELDKLSSIPLDIPLEIIYQDSDIAVINKQSGIAVHDGAGVKNYSLVNALLYHIDDLSGIGGIERPGIVHRLDKETSGLLIIAKNDNAHTKLSEMFANREIYKSYHAIVEGKPLLNNKIIEKEIGRHPVYRHKMTVKHGGKYAKTEWFVEKTYMDDSFSLLRIRIYTGRTHQIRVHLSSEGYPIIGDELYSKNYKKYKIEHLLLAATCLKFKHPVTGIDMHFKLDLPDRFNKFIERCGEIQ